ncbi:hypothetical protein PoB_003779500 [Plakobranchus ocellatus]|uniref:Uncharacterized protein n=1 Tax=Plakobranchus ocellatus TaxID=259542 RepID=A0AAV4ASK6_9GAST|nr:hypothetical protein PoB_003779500 [Plakobranchus ocellatus]
MDYSGVENARAGALPKTDQSDGAARIGQHQESIKHLPESLGDEQTDKCRNSKHPRSVSAACRTAANSRVRSHCKGEGGEEGVVCVCGRGGGGVSRGGKH